MADEYGEEEDEDSPKEDEKPKEKPPMPEFNKESFLARWIEENPQIEIPQRGDPDVDADWFLSEADEQALLESY